MKEELENRIKKIEQQILAQQRIASTTREAFALQAAYETIQLLQEYRQELSDKLSKIIQEEREANPNYTNNAVMFK